MVYQGGKMPETETERATTMQAWETWMGGLGTNLVDGGNPFGPSKTVTNSGTVTDGATSGLSGYTIIKANTMDEAVTAAKTCPVMLGGASIEVYETIDVMAMMGAK
jgi:hypothetical protein